MANVAISAKGLSKWFGEGEARTRAVQDVSLEVNMGEMLYIVGPSGSGKTTLLSMISGILRPNEGSVSVEGTDLWQLDDDGIAGFPTAENRLRVPGFSPLSASDHRRKRCNSIDTVGASTGTRQSRRR